MEVVECFFEEVWKDVCVGIVDYDEVVVCYVYCVVYVVGFEVDVVFLCNVGDFFFFSDFVYCFVFVVVEDVDV